MRCPNITGLEFSKKNIENLEAVRDLTKNTDMLAQVFSIGTFAAIFVGNGPLVSQFNIANTDFAKMAEALGAVPKMKRHTISRISFSAYRNATSHKEREFWKALVKGCKNE
ncbi:MULTISPECIES: hypothetical protein [Pseudoalteromonas]|uniref:hypothetical protein n=1 Tax=Pseudoalteromonas TaxID=53246 RepID=UPI000C7D9F73|nr:MULTISPECIES: hypothetical protein [unclassified Pseudoalteromonas]AUJ70088.1 hypothetical protein PNC201_08975 [Pseudoalteromonas sp. NC201]MCF7512880.1 hypothetical protein [Pseudoalteromonas sp. L7]MCF7524921.1 hypothetical protein [Pseudoalteromonas sp. L23]